MKKSRIPWYLSVWFISLLVFLSQFFILLIIVPIVLVILHIKKSKKISEAAQTLENLKNSGFDESIELSDLIAKQKEEKVKYEQEFAETKKSIENTKLELQNLKNQFIEQEELVLMQSFGFYEPKYDLTDSAAYKLQLELIRTDQKEKVKAKTATTQNNNWTVNGSKTEGKKMVNDSIKLAIRSFNNECDVAISKVTVANIDSTEKRITKSFETINSLNKTYNISIRNEYLNLKLKELYLALEYAQKLEDEKEEQRLIKEQMREEEKVRREIAKLKEKVEKEEKHFIQAISKLEEQKANASEEQLLDLENKILELQNKLNEVLEQKEDVLNREKNTRAGYVYIISNIGSFGDDVFKIGMTRRLEPLDRVKELGDASVPFRFDVHAMIFSEDAPTLENILHKTFNNNRLNLINEKKEFFQVPLDEIKRVVENNYDKTVEFTLTAIAEEYRESKSLKNNSQKIEQIIA